MKDAVNAKGIDRHLFGMKIIHMKEIGGDLPAIYQDPAFAKSTHHKYALICSFKSSHVL